MTKTTATKTTTTNERDTGIKERSQPLTVSMGDILRAAMEKKPMAGGRLHPEMVNDNNRVGSLTRGGRSPVNLVEGIKERSDENTKIAKRIEGNRKEILEKSSLRM